MRVRPKSWNRLLRLPDDASSSTRPAGIGASTRVRPRLLVARNAWWSHDEPSSITDRTFVRYRHHSSNASRSVGIAIGTHVNRQRGRGRVLVRHVEAVDDGEDAMPQESVPPHGAVRRHCPLLAWLHALCGQFHALPDALAWECIVASLHPKPPAEHRPPRSTTFPPLDDAPHPSRLVHEW